MFWELCSAMCPLKVEIGGTRLAPPVAEWLLVVNFISGVGLGFRCKELMSRLETVGLVSGLEA